MGITLPPPHLTPTQQKDWNAAHILYTNDILACVVGSAAAAFYGSDDLWVQVLIIVQDSAFEAACEILHTNGYTDAPMNHWHDAYMIQQTLHPHTDKQEPVKWRLLSSGHQNGWDAILAPASHWHFDITEDTTAVVDGIRLPTYASYLQGR